MKQIKLLVAVLLAVSITACSTAPKITSGSVVKVEYKGTLKDGTVFDSTDGKAPLSFLMGSGQVLPKFEEHIAKISAGKSGKFTLKAEDAYGVADPSKVVKIPRDERFKGVDLKEGVVIFANNKLATGEVKQTPMKVVGVSDTEVTMDYNHPLAGQDLTFEVKIIDVTAPQSAAPAAAEETQSEA
ncbi:MAG: peptidylprolyl isomerase [Candidatus Melainabacteria bacterium]|jgi:peptidylprolyl isomerase|nr:peptidylprolyl isomerase [Candidatus Melainabacteria bacterium]